MDLAREDEDQDDGGDEQKDEDPCGGPSLPEGDAYVAEPFAACGGECFGGRDGAAEVDFAERVDGGGVDDGGDGQHDDGGDAAGG